jgi:uncharacterized protein (DUF1684 family)
VHHSTVDYEWGVAHERQAKDSFFRSSAHSPLPPTERTSFQGLAYFPIDPALRFEGRALIELADGDGATLQIATSDGAFRPARRLGRLGFAVHGEPRSLLAYDLGTGHGSLFVPFLDATSGADTYGAGRYLDLLPEEDGTYVLDFNLAYHPYCAYSPDYSCPLTPAENRLPDRIEAGERLTTGDDR